MKDGFKTFKMSITAFLFLLLVVLSTPLASFSANNPSDDFLDFIAGFQDEISGGIKEEYVDEPQALETDWALMAFSASGYDSSTVGTPKNMIDFAKGDACSLNTLTDIERRILSLESAGIDSRNLSECDLSQKLIAEIRESGQIGESLTSTVFGVLALSASKRAVPEETITYIINNQKEDGGWDSGWGSESNITAQTIMALKSSGRNFENETIEKAKIYLKSLQTSTGGIKYDSNEWSTESDAFSNSFTLQAIYSLGESPLDEYWLKNGKSIVDDLSNLRNPNGSYKFNQAYGNMNPVWTTSIALIATNHKYLPVLGTDLKPWREAITPSLTPTPSQSIVVSPTPTAITTIASSPAVTASAASTQAESPNKTMQKNIVAQIQPTASTLALPISPPEQVTLNTEPTVLGAVTTEAKEQWKWIAVIVIFSILAGGLIAFLERKYVKKY